MDQGTIVLCGANAYEKKYYLNAQFQKLPETIRQELQIMCVLFTNDVGGIFLLEFDENGRLHFRIEAAETDFSYDEIGAELKIKELQREKGELLLSLELFYQMMLAGKL